MVIPSNKKARTSRANMSGKPATARMATARGFITMPPDLIDHLTALKKGNAYEIARLAGIMGAKRTMDLIPPCHRQNLDNMSVRLEADAGRGQVQVTATAKAHSPVGIDMEVLVAVNVALLTLYDMGKAVARGMKISGVTIVREHVPSQQAQRIHRQKGRVSIKLTHLNKRGEAHMVNVGEKDITSRTARAEGHIIMPTELANRLVALRNGEALEVARRAGVSGAERTWEIIPLCHSLDIEKVLVRLIPDVKGGKIRVAAEARCNGRTGVEMEALTAVSTALLTLYHGAMILDKNAHILVDGVRLLHKSGGKSGTWECAEAGEKNGNSHG